MFEDGWIENVYRKPTGSDLSADAPIGSSVLFVEDVYDFNPTGGQFTLNGSAATAYLSTDPAAQSITLVAPTTVAAFAGDTVLVHPYGETTWAMVNLHDDDEGVRAMVPFAWLEKLSEGLRDPSDQESVTITDESGRWEIYTVNGEVPVIDGTYIDPATLPDPGGPTAVPPATPALSAAGLADAIMLVSDAPDAPTTNLEYHMSTVDGFTPDPTTLIAGSPTRSTVFSVTALPDGSPLQPDVVYFFKSVAVNDIGAAPTASNQASASLDPTKVSELLLSILEAGDITAGRINVGPGYWDPNEGLVIPQGGGDTTVISANASTPSTWAGRVLSSFMSLVDGLITGLVEVLGTIRLNAGVTKPKVVPQVLPAWEYTKFDGVSSYGLAKDPTNTYWVTFDRANQRIKRFLISDPTQVSYVNLASYFASEETPVAFTVANGLYVVLFRNTFGSADRYDIVAFNTSGGSEALTWNVCTPSQVYVGHPTLGVGSDGKVLIAFPRSNGTQIRFIRYTVAPDPQFFDFVDQVDIGYNNGGKEVAGGVARGSFDMGAEHWVYATESLQLVQVWNATTNAHVPSRQWARAGGTRIRGIYWDGTRFWHMRGDGWLAKYATGITLEGDRTFKYAWASEDGTKETEASPILTEWWDARAWVDISTGTPPEATLTGANRANRIAIYVGPSAGPATLQQILPVGVHQLRLDGYTTTGAQSRATNDFASVASPGVMESTGANTSTLFPHWQLKGDGSGKAGTYQWSSSGLRIDVDPWANYITTGTTNVGTSTWTTRAGWTSSGNGTNFGITFPGGGVWQFTYSGLYIFTGLISFAANTTVSRRVGRVLLNGATEVVRDEQSQSGSAQQPVPLKFNFQRWLAAGDTIEFQGWQNTGGNLAWDGVSANNTVQVSRVFGTY